MVDDTYQQCIDKLDAALEEKGVGEQMPKGRSAVFLYLELKLKIKFLTRSIQVYESRQEKYAKKARKYNDAAISDSKEGCKLQFDIVVQLQNDKEELKDLLKQIEKDKEKHKKQREGGKQIL